MTTKEHWNKIFTTKPEEQLSWFQPYPKTSIEFIELFNLPPESKIIDIGGGDSHLIDALIEKGYRNLYVLDIAEIALQKAKSRLGDNSDTVQWIVSDILDFKPQIKFDFWHDRAAFHFLTTESKIDQYIEIAQQSIRSGGYLILGTFSDTGPAHCSGLEIKQYTEASMSDRFEEEFEKIKCIREDHLTPFNTTQNFLYCSFRRK